MSPSSKLHKIDLSLPEKAWLEKLFHVSNLKEALEKREGPQLFAELKSWEEIVDLWAPLPNFTLRSLEGSEPPLFLLTQAKDHHILSKNPDDWSDLSSQNEANEISILYLENPSHSNGLCLSLNWIVKLLQLQPQAARRILLVDETLSAFQWDIGEEIGRVMTLPQNLLLQWETYITWQMERTFEPQNSKLTLWPAPGLATDRCKRYSHFRASPLMWKLLQRDFFKEAETLRRRHLALRNLKTLANKLRPLFEEKKMAVKLWPLAGAWMELEILDPLLENSEILSRSLSFWGLKIQNSRIRISYLRETRDFEAALSELVECFQKASRAFPANP
jgi:hypothetical protein